MVGYCSRICAIAHMSRCWIGDRRVGVRDVEVADVRVGVAHGDVLLEVDRRLVPPAHEVRDDALRGREVAHRVRRRDAARAWPRMLLIGLCSSPRRRGRVPSSGGVRRPPRPPRRGRGAGPGPSRSWVRRSASSRCTVASNPGPPRSRSRRHDEPGASWYVIRQPDDLKRHVPSHEHDPAEAPLLAGVPRPRRRGGLGARLLGSRRPARCAPRGRARPHAWRRRWARGCGRRCPNTGWSTTSTPSRAASAASIPATR